MEEKTIRKLHPVVEVLIIAVIVLALSLLRGLVFTKITALVISGQMTVKTLSTLNLVTNLILSPLCLFLGGVVCFKLIEKRPVHWGIVLLISVVYQLLMWFPTTVVTTSVGNFGGTDLLAAYSKISAFVSPVLSATVMTLVVRLLTSPKAEDAPPVQISLVSHVLLLLFTCGIWQLIWIYRTTRYLNCVPGEEYRNPATKLLLCMFVPFYSIYWVYKSAQRIDKLAAVADVVSDLAVVCLILEIFVPLIPPILMQDKINKVLEPQ